ncbi:MAG: D-TA family PLP-dependent enzyme [Tannerellaceae bacterium]|jgi:D-serine deaminase-like pyridoxal phosphate-dependent protein|nr:D-TA family PLP-dependent enzyme [Tannerellaceae bacterium]
MYAIRNIEEIDSPALVVYEELVRENIWLAIEMAGGVDKLRPHVKTHKMYEVCRMMLNRGITKFKCATLAEAETLAMAAAPDVLLAYQPVGPKVGRLLNLVGTYPDSRFSCLIDNWESARAIDEVFGSSSFVAEVFIDVNVGMNRTGIPPAQAVGLAQALLPLRHLRLVGLHGYDGHIHDTDLKQRQTAADASFAALDNVYQSVLPLFAYPLIRVMGGTPTFPLHVHRPGVECSPGTFVFWDGGYREAFPDMPFRYAALVISRVISVIDERRICLDLGHKSVASESPLPRVHFLNAPDVTPVAHSEEHLVAETPDSRLYPPGTVLYGVPVHICPTVALYEKAFVVRGGEVTTTWMVNARNRFITI